jgi:SAM-dependent methyltransferase
MLKPSSSALLSEPSHCDESAFERVLPRLCDPRTGEPLTFDGSCFRSSNSAFRVVQGIPRFVADDGYAASFSFEWLNGGLEELLELEQDAVVLEGQFAEKTGLSRDELRGKLVLDAGVGAGQFAEVASRWGADVIGVDLSRSVEAASRNLANRPNVWIAQADLAALPFSSATYDVVFSIDVLHHTPDPRGHFFKLAELLKPGGILAVCVHPNQPTYRIRRRWSQFIRRLPLAMFYEWCRWSVPRIHARTSDPLVVYLRKVFPISAQRPRPEQDIRETFGYYTPRYQSLHSPQEVRGWFEDAGFEDIRELSNGQTCLRGRQPLRFRARVGCHDHSTSMRL